MTYALSVAWLIGLIVAPIGIYWFVIRPKARILDTPLREVWRRYATLLWGAFGAVVTVLPDLLQMLAGLDYQKPVSEGGLGLPAPWSIFAGPFFTIGGVFIRALLTTPGNEPPSGEA